MKLGLLSAILGELDFEDMIKCVSENGYECVEVACWPKGTADRRYAGITHIDVNDLDDDKVQHIKDVCQKYGVTISALSYYPNMMDKDLEQREAAISHIYKLIHAAKKLSVDVVGTFIGRIPEKTVEENIKLFSEIWPPIIQEAERSGVRIAIENCPMLFTDDEWPGGKNLAYSPEIWRRLFEIAPNKNFGLNYDPSHFIWQRMDYIKPIYEFKERIFHIHFKDIKVYQDKLDQVGVMATPLKYMAPKLPGLGDVDWEAFCQAVNETGYDGAACVEIEDRDFEGSLKDIIRALKLSRVYMGAILGKM